MKTIAAIAFAAASLMTPVAFISTSSSALAQQQCAGPNVPEGWLRPGGFCDQLNNKGSVIEQDNDDCNYEIELMLFSSLAKGDRLLVAEDCQTPCQLLCGASMVTPWVVLTPREGMSLA